jgi:hypothetical protein
MGMMKTPGARQLRSAPYNFHSVGLLLVTRYLTVTEYNEVYVEELIADIKGPKRSLRFPTIDVEEHNTNSMSESPKNLRLVTN